jgi:hypothetical protein
MRFKELAGNKMFELKEKGSKLNIANSRQHMKNAGYYLPFIIGFILIIGAGIGGYYILKNYRDQEQIKSFATAGEGKRDEQRMEDVAKIKEALENYAREKKGSYPKTEGPEKISDSNSSSFLALRNGNYISRLYADPLPDKYSYNYASDGRSYEVSAILEKQKDKCVPEGDVCVYRLSGTYVITEEDIESGKFLDKCEFPKNKEDYVLEYIKTESMKDYGGSYSAKYQLTHVTTVQYAGSYVWGIITVMKFASGTDADNALKEKVGYAPERISECEIGGTRGFCTRMTYGGKLKNNDPAILFTWKERNTIRSLNFNVIAEKESQIAGSDEKGKIVRKAAEMFLIIAKDCNVDLGEDYAAPYLKRMSF